MRNFPPRGWPSLKPPLGHWLPTFLREKSLLRFFTPPHPQGVRGGSLQPGDLFVCASEISCVCSVPLGAFFSSGQVPKLAWLRLPARTTSCAGRVFRGATSLLLVLLGPFAAGWASCGSPRRHHGSSGRARPHRVSLAWRCSFSSIFFDEKPFARVRTELLCTDSAAAAHAQDRVFFACPRSRHAAGTDR